MKYCSQWRQAVSQLPSDLQPYCIDYKKYKKLIKTYKPDALFLLLQDDAKQTDSVFKNATPSRRIWPWPLLCGVPNAHAPTHSSLSEYAKLNTTTLYKVCKRLDKHFGTSRTFMTWYETLRAQRIHEFVSNMTQVCLHIESTPTHTPPEDCPICLEVPDTKPYTVLACGHIICNNCAFEMLGVAHARGTTQNKIAHGAFTRPEASRCPMCRDHKAFRCYKQYIPKTI